MLERKLLRQRVTTGVASLAIAAGFLVGASGCSGNAKDLQVDREIGTICVTPTSKSTDLSSGKGLIYGKISEQYDGVNIFSDGDGNLGLSFKDQKEDSVRFADGGTSIRIPEANKDIDPLHPENNVLEPYISVPPGTKIIFTADNTEFTVQGQKIEGSHNTRLNVSTSCLPTASPSISRRG